MDTLRVSYSDGVAVPFGNIPLDKLQVFRIAITPTKYSLKKCDRIYHLMFMYKNNRYYQQSDRSTFKAVATFTQNYSSGANESLELSEY